MLRDCSVPLVVSRRIRSALPAASMRPDCSARSSSPSIRLRPLAAASSVCSMPMTVYPASSAAGRDARSHQSQADHADGLDLSRLDVFEAGNLGGRPLGEEHVPQRRRLLRIAQRQERSPLLRQSVRERSVDGQSHQSDRFARRILAAGACQRLAGRRIDGFRGRRRDVARAAAAQGGSGQRPRLRDRRRAQVAAFDPVHDAELQRLAGWRNPAGRDQVDGGGDADQARQALRAARAGHDAELHLGQRQRWRWGRRSGDASRARPPARRRAPRR